MSHLFSYTYFFKIELSSLNHLCSLVRRGYKTIARTKILKPLQKSRNCLWFKCLPLLDYTISRDSSSKGWKGSKKEIALRKSSLKASGGICKSWQSLYRRHLLAIANFKWSQPISETGPRPRSWWIVRKVKFSRVNFSRLDSRLWHSNISPNFQKCLEAEESCHSPSLLAVAYTFLDL